VASAGLYASLHLIPDNHTNIPPLSFLQAGCPSCRPTNSVKALKAVYCSTNTGDIKPHSMYSFSAILTPTKYISVVCKSDKQHIHSPAHTCSVNTCSVVMVSKFSLMVGFTKFWLPLTSVVQYASVNGK